MRRSEALQGVRVVKFVNILDRYEAAELNQLEAAELLDSRRHLHSSIALLGARIRR